MQQPFSYFSSNSHCYHDNVATHLFVWIFSSTEEESRLDELPSSACDEVRQGHFGIQGYCQSTSQIQGQNDPYFIQLSSIAQVRN